MDQLDISTGEFFLLGGLTLIGILMILVPKQGEKTFFGIVVLSAIMTIAYSDHRDHLEKEFVIKRFSQGNLLQCGLWRGESILIDPNNGWRWENEIGFIKNDTVRSDPGLCHVIGEEAPKPFVFSYLAVLLIELALCFTLRSLVQSLWHPEEEEDASDKDYETSTNDKIKQETL